MRQPEAWPHEQRVQPIRRHRSDSARATQVSQAGRGRRVTATWLPSVPGSLTADQNPGHRPQLAAEQQRDRRDRLARRLSDAWNHVECAMALSVCGLALRHRRAYEWAPRRPRPDGSWPKLSGDGTVLEEAVDATHAA